MVFNDMCRVTIFIHEFEFDNNNNNNSNNHKK